MADKSCYACYAEIAEIVANTKGLYFSQTKGKGGTNLLNRIWHALGEVVENDLLSKKSCIVTNFFHASIKKQHVDEFEGKSIFYKPQFILLPDFTSKFHLQNVLTVPDAHYHATVPKIVSCTAIATLAGTDRFVVEAALTDSICEIGKYLVRNPQKVLRIDVGVAFLEFRDREYRVKWCDEFLNSFSDAVGPKSLVKPYDPPKMCSAATGCRFQTSCLSNKALQTSVNINVEKEKRTGIVEMNNSSGGSNFRKTFW